jgi:hypothetical protein
LRREFSQHTLAGLGPEVFPSLSIVQELQDLGGRILA